MIALGISKRQEFYNQERRHWRGADAVFYIAERFSFNESPSAFSISGGDFIH